MREKPKPRNGMPQLNSSQECFARHVAAGRNLTESARISGYSNRSATTIGHRLSKRPAIQTRIRELRESERFADSQKLLNTVIQMLQNLQASS